jgi:hypothetical protein
MGGWKISSSGSCMEAHNNNNKNSSGPGERASRRSETITVYALNGGSNVGKGPRCTHTRAAGLDEA